MREDLKKNNESFRTLKSSHIHNIQAPAMTFVLCCPGIQQDTHRVKLMSKWNILAFDRSYRLFFSKNCLCSIEIIVDISIDLRIIFLIILCLLSTASLPPHSSKFSCWFPACPQVTICTNESLISRLNTDILQRPVLASAFSPSKMYLY